MCNAKDKAQPEMSTTQIDIQCACIDSIPTELHNVHLPNQMANPSDTHMHVHRVAATSVILDNCYHILYCCMQQMRMQYKQFGWNCRHNNRVRQWK